MTTARPKLSVIVPTGNRADQIEDCLRSVRWADEVIVVDSHSTDGTYDIALRYADRVLRNDYDFSAKQKNWAIPQASHEWVLIIDTDERVTRELQQQIEAVLREPMGRVGFRIPRLNFLFGAPVKTAGYYPDYQLRLFRRDLGRYDLRRVHAHLQIDGAVGTLAAPLAHYAHRSLNQTLSNLLLLMTTWEAEQRATELQRAEKSATHLLALNLLARPVAAFLLRYIRQGGWRDGHRGLIVSVLWAIYVAVTYMKVWERSLALPKEWWHEDWEKQAHSIDWDSNGHDTTVAGKLRDDL